MNDELRRAGDAENVKDHDKFMRSAAHISKWLGTLQLVVQILGRSILWILEVRDARAAPRVLADGSSIAPYTPTYPDMPWSYWLSLAGFAVLMLLAAALYRNQIDNPGRVFDLFLGWIPKRGQTTTIEADNLRATVESDAPDK